MASMLFVFMFVCLFVCLFVIKHECSFMIFLLQVCLCNGMCIRVGCMYVDWLCDLVCV
jgi:hypothetical protein